MPYITQIASAQKPSSCKGKYIRIAVLEVNEGVQRASMISEKSRDIVRIVRIWEMVNVGTTPRAANHRVMAEAQKLAETLNQGESK